MKSLAMALVVVLLGGCVSQPQVGRYQFQSNGSTAFIIDTATGQVWSNYNDRNHFYEPKLPTARP